MAFISKHSLSGVEVEGEVMVEVQAETEPFAEPIETAQDAHDGRG